MDNSDSTIEMLVKLLYAWTNFTCSKQMEENGSSGAAELLS